MILMATNAAATWDFRLVDYVVDLGLFVVFAGILFCMVRLVRGPHLADRAIALDTIAIHIIGLVILLTLRLDSLVLFDGALVLSLVGFAGTVAVAQYITRARNREVTATRHRDDATAATKAESEQQP